MNSQDSTLKLSFKAFKEVVSTSPALGLFYPLAKNLHSILGIINVGVMGLFIDNVADILASKKDVDMSLLLDSEAFDNFLLLLLIFMLRTFFSKSYEYIESALYDIYTSTFQAQRINKISKLNLEDIETRKIKDLLTTVPTYAQPAVWDNYRLITELIYYLITFVSAGYFILTQMAWWGLLVALLVLPEALFRYYFNVKLKQKRDYDANKRKYFNYLYNQSTSPSLLPENFPELRVDNVFKFFKKSFKQSAYKYYDDQNRIRKRRAIFNFIWSSIDGSFTRIVQFALIPIAIINLYSIGTFKALFDYIGNYYSASWYIVWRSLRIKETALYLKDYYDFFEYKGFGDVAEGNEKLSRTVTPKIEFVNVDFSYPDSKKSILQDISFTITPGEKVAIIGQDESGKSTIARLLCGLYRVGPGDILIDNISIKNLKRGQLKNKISVVFENYVKYNFSIRKNIVVTEPDDEFDRKLYDTSLSISGLKKWMKKQDVKDSQILGKLFANGIEISTGHWQRLAIARAIYRNKQILILDESFTQIDGFSRRPILEKIVSYKPKQTLINITQEDTDHDLYDKIIYIEDGKIKQIKNNSQSNSNNPKHDS